MQVPQKALILTTNHVGNNIFCTPAIRLLKQQWPQTTFDVLASSARGVSVFENNSDINKSFKLTRSGAIRKLVSQYDLIIGLHHDKTNEYLKNSAVKAMIMHPYSGTQHRAQETLEFIKASLNCNIDIKDYRYVLCPRQQDHEKIKIKLSSNQDKILIGLHLGSGRTSVHGWKIWYSRRDADPRLWPLENYIALAKMLITENSNIRFVLTGGRNERFLAKKFLKQVPNTIDLVGKTTLLEMTALMNYLKVYITQDTGPLHVACATKVPIIGLFGPTQPERTGPYPVQPQHVIIKKNVMTEINPAEVFPHVMEKITA